MSVPEEARAEAALALVRAEQDERDARHGHRVALTLEPLLAIDEREAEGGGEGEQRERGETANRRDPVGERVVEAEQVAQAGAAQQAIGNDERALSLGERERPGFPLGNAGEAAECRLDGAHVDQARLTEESGAGSLQAE